MIAMILGFEEEIIFHLLLQIQSNKRVVSSPYCPLMISLVIGNDEQLKRTGKPSLLQESPLSYNPPVSLSIALPESYS